MKEKEARMEELIKFMPKASPKSLLNKISLIFDIIRGNVKGNLGKHIDDVLGVSHGDGNCYLYAVAGMVNDVVHNARSQNLKFISKRGEPPAK